MRERNARLLRAYIKFCGPERLPEFLEDKDHGKKWPNPIIADFRTVFDSNNTKQKTALSRYMLNEMRSIRKKYFSRKRRAKVIRELDAALTRNFRQANQRRR